MIRTQTFTITFFLFALQLFLCFRCRNPLLRHGILATLALMEAALWISYLIRPDFFSYIIGVLALNCVAGVLFAWLIYAIVKYVQKRRK